MKTLGYTFWREESHWVGYLDAYPDYWTQGESDEDLKTHLLELFHELSNGTIPQVRQHAELELA